MSERRFVRIGVILTAVVAGGCALILFSRFNGDALIYLPFARNAAHGDFFSFNPGEFSSGSTSPLWPLLLAPAFAFGDGISGAKIIGILFLGVALYVSYRTSYVTSGSRAGATVALVATTYFLAIPALLLFESALAVIAVNAIISFLHKMRARTEIAVGHRIGFACALAALLLTRPEGIVVVIISAVFTIVSERKREGRRSIAHWIILFVVASLPATVYYGYSYITTGAASMSSSSRSFAFAEGATSIYGGHWSPEMALLFVRFPLVVWFGLAAYGTWCTRARGRSRSLLVQAWLTVVAFVVMTTVAVPVVASPGRYVLLVLPFLCFGLAHGVKRLVSMSELPRMVQRCLAPALVIVAVVLPLGQLAFHAVREYRRGESLDAVTDRTVTEFINAHAPDHSTALIYEVQERWGLRPDITVISLDGLTDTRVTPYRADLAAFIKRYKPRFVVTNQAMIRGYLSKSILGDVQRSAGETPGRTVTREGIGFTLALCNREPVIEGTVHWNNVYELSYATE